MSWEKFWVLLSQHKCGLKALLMDQEFVAGIGNMYADEILFAAGLRYDRRPIRCPPKRSAASTARWSRRWPRR